MAREKFVDVCVIGGAGSGLMAAARAKEAGAEKVLLIDKSKLFGGCTRIAGGFFAVGTDVQRRQGIKIDVDDAYRTHMNRNLWNCDAKLVRDWYLNTKEIVRWLEEHGIQFGQSYAFSGHSRLFMNIVGGGSGLVKQLIKINEDLGVEMLLRTRGKKLLKDEAGEICGLIAEDEEGEFTIHAKSVMICTGAISNNPDLLARMYPGKCFDNVQIITAVEHNTGDGFLMAEEAGGKVGPMHTLYIGPQNHPFNMRVGNIMRRPQMLMVNRNGERFVDESLPVHEDWGWMRSNCQDRQPGRMCWSIMDQSIFDEQVNNKRIIIPIEAFQGSSKNQNLTANYGTEQEAELVPDHLKWLDMLKDDFKVEAENGRVLICDTLDEAAEWIGADPEVLKETVEHYNKLCADGYDDDFLKMPEFMMPLTTPPYYVLAGRQGIDTCIGGITINSKMQVMDNNDKPIKNLYAAGVATSGWCNNAYAFFGTCMSLTLYSGFAGGVLAAKNAMAK